MRKTARTAAVIGTVCLVLAACGERQTEEAAEPTESPSATETSASASPTASATNTDFKACMVSDSGGFNDKSFNQTSYAGLQSAAQKLGIATAEAESQVEADFKDNIAEMVAQDCDSITTDGFLLGDATLKSAKANPEIDYSIVDFAYFNEAGKNIAPPNLKGLTFNTAEPSFLAGYLAAATSQSGVVGTFGGVNIPTVTIFMTGFAQGVERYNEDNGADVQVIGWNPDSEKGSFTNDFENKSLGQTTAEGMITQGADVIFPVAGPAGLGGLQAAQDNDVKAIWVDTDGCVSAAEYCDVLLTSVVKGMDVAVEAAITDSMEGDFSNEPYTGTLENGGVGLAPYGPSAEVDAELESTIEELKQGIIDGSIKVG